MKDIDVWRSAHHMMKRYGDDAAVQAAIRADQFLAKGDLDGFNVWKRVVAAISELEREPSAGDPRN